MLEAFCGYLLLAQNLSTNKLLNGEAFNFGPNYKNSISVIRLIKKVKKKWPTLKWIIEKSPQQFESKLLKLNSNKAKKNIGWKCVLSADETIDYVINWYKYFYLDKEKKNVSLFKNQIKNYILKLRKI